MKEVLVIAPTSGSGFPAYERVKAYIDYFKSRGFSVFERPAPGSPWELMRLIVFIYRSRIRNVLVTMPVFRNWLLCYLPFVRVVLDVRDGWSIAMASGYGGVMAPNRPKAFLARLVERQAIRRADVTVTCTTGLQAYLWRVAGTTPKMLMNGVSDEDYALAQSVNKDVTAITHDRKRLFVCAGKFSEYGRHHIERVFEVIFERYGDRKCLIKVFGAEVASNEWIDSYLKRKYHGQLEFELSSRLSKSQLYKEMALADCAIAVIRDPTYEYGTKIFDYIALGLPVLDYFDSDNEFKRTFHSYLDTGDLARRGVEVRRSVLVNELDLGQYLC